MEPRIVCSALKSEENIICGPRHFDSIMRQQIKRIDIARWTTAEQGFIDQFGTFYSREDAWNIAEKNGQIIRRCCGDDGKLFSENLY